MHVIRVDGSAGSYVCGIYLVDNNALLAASYGRGFDDVILAAASASASRYQGRRGAHTTNRCRFICQFPHHPFIVSEKKKVEGPGRFHRALSRLLTVARLTNPLHASNALEIQAYLISSGAH